MVEPGHRYQDTGTLSKMNKVMEGGGRKGGRGEFNLSVTVRVESSVG